MAPVIGGPGRTWSGRRGGTGCCRPGRSPRREAALVVHARDEPLLRTGEPGRPPGGGVDSSSRTSTRHSSSIPPRAMSPAAMPERCACQPWAVGMAGDGSVAVGAVNVLGPRASGRTVATSSCGTRPPARSCTRSPAWDPVGVAVTPDGRYAVVNGRDGIAVVDLGSGERGPDRRPGADDVPGRGRPDRRRRPHRSRRTQRPGAPARRGVAPRSSPPASSESSSPRRSTARRSAGPAPTWPSECSTDA